MREEVLDKSIEDWIMRLMQKIELQRLWSQIRKDEIPDFVLKKNYTKYEYEVLMGTLVGVKEGLISMKILENDIEFRLTEKGMKL